MAEHTKKYKDELVQQFYGQIVSRIQTTNDEFNRTGKGTFITITPELKKQILAKAHVKAYSEARKISRKAEKASLLILWEIHRKEYFRYDGENESIDDFIADELVEEKGFENLPASIGSDLSFIVKELFPALEKLSKLNPDYANWHPEKIVENDGAYSRMRASVSYLRTIVRQKTALIENMERYTSTTEKKIRRIEKRIIIAGEDEEGALQEELDRTKADLLEKTKQAEEKMSLVEDDIQNGFIRAASLIANPNIPAESGDNSVRKQLRSVITQDSFEGYYLAKGSDALVIIQVPEKLIPVLQGLVSSFCSLVHMTNFEEAKKIFVKFKKE